MMLWFTETVFRWRTLASCVWLSMICIPGLLTLRLTTDVLMWHPLFSVNNVLYSSGYLTLLVIFCFMYSQTYTVSLPVFKTRLMTLWNVIQPIRALIILVFSVLGGLCSYCLAGLVGYSGLWHTCQTDRMKESCLNEYALLCIACGFFSGFCYGCSYYLYKEYFLVFPSIQQNILFRLRGHLISHLWEGILWSIKVLRFFYPFYYFGGSVLCMYVEDFLNLMPPEGPLTTISGLLDFSLLVHLIIITTFNHFFWTLGLRFFRTYQTQAVTFPIIATFSGETSRLIGVALKSNILLLKLLGYLDLYQLSLHSCHRRKQIFSLTPSGQPQTWKLVCEECVSTIKTLTAKLSAGKMTNDTTIASMVSPQVNETFTVPYSSSVEKQGATKGWPSLDANEILSTPGATRRNITNEKARLWSYSPGNSVEGISNHESNKKSPLLLNVGYLKLQSALSSILRQLTTTLKVVAGKLKRKPIFIYFLSELPDVANQELYTDCQLQVWAITSISELAVASYTEDTYGVVQRSLSLIIESLIDLSQALDKHVKAPLSSSKSTRNIYLAKEMNGRYAIKTAVQTALYRLAATFSKEKRSIPLSHSHHLYWNNYFSTQ